MLSEGLAPRTATKVNLGIVAHVDAGKTTLTERLLYTAGVIHRIGSVDKGTTQTDTLELERRRGITIKSAVVSFALGDLSINLIDTPGHHDFISEVERVLGVLDAAVLVVSAVEGVQPQTRALMRTLRRLRIPTIIFVNKIDRRGADPDRVADEIHSTLGVDVVAMGVASSLESRDATFTASDKRDPRLRSALVDLLSLHDTDLLAQLVADETTVSIDRLLNALVAKTGAAGLHPLYAGSAATGAGVDALIDGLRRFCAPLHVDSDSTSGVVFKIERGIRRERIAYVRLFSGSLCTRSSVELRGEEERITSIAVFDAGHAEAREMVCSGEIAKVVGLRNVRIGDVIGERPPALPAAAQFPPPTIEASIVAARGTDRVALLDALTELAEQDPLINLRHDQDRGDIYVSLYGEIQKQVIVDTLALDYELEVTFRDSTTVHIERLSGKGSAFEPLTTGRSDRSPFVAALGIRVEPAIEGSGNTIDSRAARGALPRSFLTALEEAIDATLAEGLHGWPVTDCQITVTHADYAAKQSSSNGTFNRAITTIANDFRLMAPMVLMDAINAAGTTVHEPVNAFVVRAPQDTLGVLLPVLVKFGATPDPPSARDGEWAVTGAIPASRVNDLQRELPSLGRGAADLETTHHAYQPVTNGHPPKRRRTSPNALHRPTYFTYVLKRI